MAGPVIPFTVRRPYFATVARRWPDGLPESTGAGWMRGLSSEMSTPACPACSLEDVLSLPDHWECNTCGHEWPKEAPAEAVRVVKDAHGNVLADGDAIVLIKDLPLRGSSGVLKQGSKAKKIRLVDGDHEIDCKIDGVAVALKACFVKKA